MFLSESDSGYPCRLVLPEIDKKKSFRAIPTSINIDRVDVMLSMCSPISVERS